MILELKRIFSPGHKRHYCEFGTVNFLVISVRTFSSVTESATLPLDLSQNKNPPTNPEVFGQQLDTWPSPVTLVRAGERAGLKCKGPCEIRPHVIGRSVKNASPD